MTEVEQEIQETPEQTEQIEAEARASAKQRYLTRSAVHGGGLVAPQGAEVELQGSSESSFQHAVECAVATAKEAIGPIDSAELKSLRVEVGDRGIARWHVRMTSRR